MQETDSIPRAPSLSGAIAEKLIHDIAFGGIALGAVLSENKLAERFGTSKTPVREALLRLQSQDLVEILPQRGAVVFQADRQLVRDLSAFRTMLETGALQHIHPDVLNDLGQELSVILDRMKSVFSLTNPHEYQVLDSLFHTAIITRAGNTFLSESYGRISTKISALRTHLSSPQGYLLEKSLEEHGEITDRIIRNDLNFASELLRDHIRRTQDFHQRMVDRNA